MEYNGIEIKEITKPQFFDPPRKMLVWDNGCGDITELKVCAITSRKQFPVICENSTWRHCAEIPESKPKPVTFRELSRWLAEGKGEVNCSNTCCQSLNYSINNENEPLSEKFSVRKWSDTEWHKPTREYLGLEDK